MLMSLEEVAAATAAPTPAASAPAPVVYKTHGYSDETKAAAYESSREIVRGVIQSIVGVSPSLLVIPNTGDVNVKLHDDLDHRHVDLDGAMEYHLDDGR